ncbi:methyl-accepting chemotaxis protein [Anaerovorax odorimutans]|uniref:methyl-accepting chemotaxis protein n=1 Tax=Anaerovorax odorimutans TaxID=109327 RepID=UPI000427B2E3|nr:methyl-accepting chemotaxis protein [Anaerovorax odorimutans]
MKLFNKMNLATKTAILILIMLIVIFIILIGFSAISTGKAIENSTVGEFNNISKSNGIQVQEIIEKTESTAENIESYVIKEYSNNQVENSDEQSEEDKNISTIYNKEISDSNYQMERYITQTARNTVVNNEDIVGVGVMFEPYQFDKNIESYAFYTSETDDDTIEPFGEYSAYSTEEYYQKAAQEKEMVFTKPYEYNGILMVTAATPILYNGEVKGVIMADFNISNFSKLDVKNESYTSMYTTIFDNDGSIVYDYENPGDVGKSMTGFYKDGEFEKAMKLFDKGEAFSMKMVNSDKEKVNGFFYPIKAGNTYWWALTEVDIKDMNKAVTTTVLWLIIISAIALIAIAIIVIFVLRKMLNPIQNVVKAATDISNGNFDIYLEAKSQDEIGILTQTFDDTAKTLKTIIQDISYVLDSIANKNLNVDISADYVGDWEQIENSMKNIINNLNDVMGDINQSSDQVSIGSEQVSAGAQELSQGATEQASSLQELSATISEVSDQVKRSAENAKNVNIAATDAGNKVDASNKQMKEMIEAISEISNKSNEIGRIIKTIDDIAFQTNILALNAAVEAARAGAAGKGFAVVAEEVRNLASKSAEAARNTTGLIEETVKAVENGTNIVTETEKSMMSVVDVVENVVVLINDITEASDSQAIAISQITEGVDQISSVVQTNSATAEESAAASEELSGQAQMLKDMVNQFILKDNPQSINDVQYDNNSNLEDYDIKDDDSDVKY